MYDRFSIFQLTNESETAQIIQPVLFGLKIKLNSC